MDAIYTGGRSYCRILRKLFAWEHRHNLMQVFFSSLCCCAMTIDWVGPGKPWPPFEGYRSPVFLTTLQKYTLSEILISPFGSLHRRIWHSNIESDCHVELLCGSKLIFNTITSATTNVDVVIRTFLHIVRSGVTHHRLVYSSLLSRSDHVGYLRAGLNRLGQGYIASYYGTVMGAWRVCLWTYRVHCCERRLPFVWAFFDPRFMPQEIYVVTLHMNVVSNCTVCYFT